MLKTYIEETGIIEMYEEIGTQDAEDRLNNINQLLTDISQFLEENEGSNLDTYLQQTSLATDFDEENQDTNRVTLMTLHSAKGLEFPIVFLAGLEQGLFPLIRSEFDKDEEEEERRLMYVGITRAKEKLIITFCKRRMKFGEVAYQLPSIFLKEIDDKYLDYPEKPKAPTVRTEVPRGLFDSKSTSGNSLKDRYSGNKSANEYSQIPDFEESYCQVSDDVNTLKVGDRVHHAQFGEGQISGLKGEGNRRQAVVRFNSVGRKMLMLKFAKLKKLA
jgi:DNA helicase-2/ATP-dependent DNA helicase PcrA